MASTAADGKIAAAASSRINSSQNDASASPSMNSKDFIVSVAANIASQPLQNYDSNVWGVLTAISNNARKRRQVLECSVIDSSSKFWFCDLMWF